MKIFKNSQILEVTYAVGSAYPKFRIKISQNLDNLDEVFDELFKNFFGVFSPKNELGKKLIRLYKSSKYFHQIIDENTEFIFLSIIENPADFREVCLLKELYDEDYPRMAYPCLLFSSGNIQFQKINTYFSDYEIRIESKKALVKFPEKEICYFGLTYEPEIDCYSRNIYLYIPKES